MNWGKVRTTGVELDLHPAFEHLVIELRF